MAAPYSGGHRVVESRRGYPLARIVVVDEKRGVVRAVAERKIHLLHGLAGGYQEGVGRRAHPSHGDGVEGDGFLVYRRVQPHQRQGAVVVGASLRVASLPQCH